MRTTLAKRLLVVGLPLLALSVGGCAGGATGVAAGANVFWVPSEAGIIQPDGWRDWSEVRRVGFVNPWQYQEYALFGGSAQRPRAEMIAVIASERDRVAINYDATLQTMLSQWKAFGGNVQWGPTGRGQTVRGWDNYRQFTAPQEGRQCVAFSRLWDLLSDDPRLRYGKALFGYYCGAPGTGLAGGEAEAFLNSVRVVLPTEMAPRPTRFAPSVMAGPRAEDALAFAQGAGVRTGNPRFPFLITAIYQIPNGGPFRRD